MSTRFEAMSPSATMPTDFRYFMTYLEDLHASSGDGEGVVVSVVDTGIGANLLDRVVGGVNLSSDGDRSNLIDRQSHGSVVCDIIAGLAPKAKFYVVRIFGNETDVPDERAGEGLKIAAANGDLTNASIGTSTLNPIMLDGIKAHESAKRSLVAAAGNSGDGNAATRELSWPAAHPHSISVGAIDRGNLADITMTQLTEKPASYSSSNPYVDVCAFGRLPNSWEMGTSFAAPIITAALACRISYARKRGLPTDDAANYAWLTDHTRQLAGFPSWNEQTGWGEFTLRPYREPRTLEVNAVTLETTVNGQAHAWSVPPRNIDGRLFFSGRGFADSFGIPTEYDDLTKIARWRM